MMDIIRRSIVLILFLVFLFSTQNYFILSLGMNNIIICKQTERTALLSFKQHLKDPSNNLSSWSGENCCRWAGVVCNNTTDHVIQLHLQELGLGGELNPSLLELKQLRHLDLSVNNFDGISIPDFLGSFQSLRYLNLSRANFGGMVPHQLGNLSNLRYLDLSSTLEDYSFEKFYKLTVVGNFQWISHLSSLKHLDLSFVNLENASNWFHAVNMLPSLLVLRLSDCYLSGALPSSLPYVNFTSLAVLDLSYNGLYSALPEWLYRLSSLEQLSLAVNFSGTISTSIGNLTKLSVLDLSGSDFSAGRVLHQLGNLSNLHYLDISQSYIFDEEVNSTDNFQWLSHLSSLQHLDLSGVNVKNASDCLHAISMLPSLYVLRLTGCGLSGALPTSLSYDNLTSLAVLDLSQNHNLNSTLPEWLYSLTNLEQIYLSSNSLRGTISVSIGNLTKLTVLDLLDNQLEGEIPITFGNLRKLQKIDLSYNRLSGPLPDELGRLINLNILDLAVNKLNGSVPESLGNLSKLGKLMISNNALHGVVHEVFFANLTNLQYLSMNSLVLKISPEWVPPFQLRSASLGTCQLGPGFPMWLRTQRILDYLDLSRTGISGTIPTWFWNFTSKYYLLDLSHNELSGELHTVLNAGHINLRSNQFNGQLPLVSPDVYELDLSSNSFSGPISTFLCNPPPISRTNNLVDLHLSDNLLSGNLSNCWVYWASLRSLRLGGNKITGKIPNSMSSLFGLEALQLSNNSLYGELPSSLRNCSSLYSIDLGENGFTGILPIWLGESFPDLKFLRLRSNKFYGEIPLELCHLSSIRVLDIAHNDLRGSIPKCFNNFSTIATKQNLSVWVRTTFLNDYVDTTTLVTKGRELEYSNTLRFVTILDLSKNSLSGEIPEELTSLVGLRSLNLSENRFTGKIPKKIGNMDLLESLDFSKNQISGVIPQSISSLSFLSYLNLSYNNLSGKIPTSAQLQSFNQSSYIGNQELCGLPLKNCSGEDPPQKPGDIGDRADEDEDWFEMKWFYMSMGVGFAVGFWSFWGVMVLKSSWRIAYFRFLDDTKDKLCLLF